MILTTKQNKDLRKQITESLTEYLNENPNSKDYVILTMKFQTDDSYLERYDVNVMYHLKDALTEVVVNKVSDLKVFSRIKYNHRIRYNKHHDSSGLPNGSNYVTYEDTYKDMMMKPKGFFVKDVHKYSGRKTIVEKEEGLATQLRKMFKKEQIQHKREIENLKFKSKMEKGEDSKLPRKM